MMDIARSILIKAGIPEKAINIQIRQKKTGMGNDILNEIVEAGYGTVVVGRRGVSRANQLLFGSVSNKIVQNTVTVHGRTLIANKASSQHVSFYRCCRCAFSG